MLKFKKLQPIYTVESYEMTAIMYKFWQSFFYALALCICTKYQNIYPYL